MSHSISESPGRSTQPSQKEVVPAPDRRPSAQRTRLRRPVDSTADRRALLVAYHYADGATGSFRWDVMVSDLAARGWHFDILTCAASEAEADRLRAAVGHDARRVRVFAVPRPAGPRRLLKGIAGAVKRVRGRGRSAEPSSAEAEVTAGGVSDWSLGTDWGRPGASRRLEAVMHFADHLAWARKAKKAGLNLAGQSDYQVIIVSSPPHAAQLVGAWLSRKLRIPYVADYRDPWTFGIPPAPYLRHPLHRRVESWYELSAMKRASLVVCNTLRQQRAVDETYEARGIRTVAVPNGYDRLPAVSKPDSEFFRIVYAGALYPYHDVRALMAACSRLRLRSGLSDELLKIEFMGRFGAAPLATLADEHGLASCFSIHPRGTRQQALELQQSAAVLVSFDHWHGLSVPMKFYDYAQMYGDLLLLTSPDSALAQAAAVIGLKACDPSDANELDEKLDAALARWRENRFDTPADRDGIYDRKRQSDRMGQLLDGLVSGEDM